MISVPKQEQVFHVHRWLTAMKIVKSTLTVTLITWTKIFLLGNSLLDIDDIVHDIVYNNVFDVWYLKLSRAESAGVLGHVPLISCYLNGNSVNIFLRFPRSFRGQIPKELQQILDPTVGLGAGSSKSTCGCGPMEGTFLVKFPWSKLWNFAKRGCRIQQESGHVALRFFGARVIEPGQRELLLRGEWYWLNAIITAIVYLISKQIIMTWPSIWNVGVTFVIVYYFNIRHQSVFVRYRSHETLLRNYLGIT
jgi:hypothetical protein